ncbi:class I SAM-dependent methyltransferase [Rhodovibrionaceae bacterium A322]
MTTTDTQAPRLDPAPGAEFYTPKSLRIYDFLVHVVSNHLLWRCPTARIQALHNQHMSNNHLDVGVGTGYFLDKGRFPTPQPRLALMDLNTHCLAHAAQRVARYKPTLHEANILEPVYWQDDKFDSIGLGYLLHCLPGSMKSKAVVFDNLKPLLNDGGCLFGATILGQGVQLNAAARKLMGLYNAKGIFTNGEDNLEDLEANLKKAFRRYDLEVVGSVALFVGYS